jgi:hypothetical protein
LPLFGTNAFVLLIASKWVEHKFAQALAEHTAKLTHDNDLEIARFKAQLEQVATERNVRFAKTYDIMANVVAEVYKNLLAVQEAALRHVATLEEETKEQSGEKLRRCLKTFADHYVPNRIYLPRQTGDKLWNFQATALVLIGNVARGDSPVVQKLLQELPQQLNDLHNDFQKLLGCPFDEMPKQNKST